MLTIGAALAVARQAAVDQARIPLEADRWAEPQSLHDSRAKSLQEHVNARHEFEEEFDAGGGLEVEG